MLNNLHKLFNGPAAIHPERWQSFLSASRINQQPSLFAEMAMNRKSRSAALPLSRCVA